MRKHALSSLAGELWSAQNSAHYTARTSIFPEFEANFLQRFTRSKLHVGIDKIVLHVMLSAGFLGAPHRAGLRIFTAPLTALEIEDFRSRK
jgi:hypothetical protein